MEAKFIVQRRMRREDCSAFAELLYGRMRIFYGAMTLLYWGYILYNFQYGWWWFDAVLILLALLLTLMTVFYPRFMGWRMWRARNAKVQQVDMHFDEEHVYIKSDVDEGTVQYAGFVRLAENSDFFYLFVQKYRGYIVPKCDFTHGNPADFGAFIAEKTGMEIQRVRG